jgi:hypothetical protein
MSSQTNTEEIKNTDGTLSANTAMLGAENRIP